MGDRSAIEWTTHTFNPWIGCAKVSPGCKHCYAETLMDTRYGRVEWGVNGTRVRTSPANWKKPERWNRGAAESGERVRVFCASLADVFEDRPDIEPWRADLCALIDRTPNLDWQLLTKRPEHVMGMVPPHWRDALPSHVWIGTSVENQEYADLRIPELLRIPARVHFLSCEPLLGPVVFPLPSAGSVFWSGIHWVIVGGESGPGARSMDVTWAESIVRQCAAAGVPAFVKQLGACPSLDGLAIRVHDKKGGDWDEFAWSEVLRVREFPAAAAHGEDE